MLIAKIRNQNEDFADQDEMEEFTINFIFITFLGFHFDEYYFKEVFTSFFINYILINNNSLKAFTDS